MIKKILGILLLSSPFIAIALLPLYTSYSWSTIGMGYGIAIGIIEVKMNVWLVTLILGITLALAAIGVGVWIIQDSTRGMLKEGIAYSLIAFMGGAIGVSLIAWALPNL